LRGTNDISRAGFHRGTNDISMAGFYWGTNDISKAGFYREQMISPRLDFIGNK